MFELDTHIMYISPTALLLYNYIFIFKSLTLALLYIPDYLVICCYMGTYGSAHNIVSVLFHW